jgi:hypothetical protein
VRRPSHRGAELADTGLISKLPITTAATANALILSPLS